MGAELITIGREERQTGPDVEVVPSRARDTRRSLLRYPLLPEEEADKSTPLPILSLHDAIRSGHDIRVWGSIPTGIEHNPLIEIATIVAKTKAAQGNPNQVSLVYEGDQPFATNFDVRATIGGNDAIAGIVFATEYTTRLVNAARGIKNLPATNVIPEMQQALEFIIEGELGIAKKYGSDPASFGAIRLLKDEVEETFGMIPNRGNLKNQIVGELQRAAAGRRKY